MAEARQAPSVAAALVDIRQLTVVYRAPGRDLCAVNEVNLSIGRGKTLALLGESGSGKTSLAKALLRLIEPNRGRVEIGGVDLRGLSGRQLRRFRRRAQVVFQDAGGSLTPTLTVGGLLRDTLASHGRHRSSSRDEAQELLAAVGLDPCLGTRYPHELSGGQRQRVALARALALQPELLVLDEPLSALDVPAQLALLDLLAGLRSGRDLAILLITHHVDAARWLADEVAVMYAGRIVEQGPAGIVLEAPAHPYTQALLAALPSLQPGARGPRPPHFPARSQHPLAGCEYRPRCPHATEVCAQERPVLAASDSSGGLVQLACHVPSSDTARRSD